jgi:hypothetical protein
MKDEGWVRSANPAGQRFQPKTRFAVDLLNIQQQSNCPRNSSLRLAGTQDASLVSIDRAGRPSHAFPGIEPGADPRRSRWRGRL